VTAPVNTPGINAPNGWILLRGPATTSPSAASTANFPGAEPTRQRIAQNARVVAGKWIDVYGDSTR
jgi:hypothetical protein